MDIFTMAYIFVALTISLFYGFFAGRIFIVGWKEYKFLKRVYQFIFNFLGGVYGFSVLYFMLYKVKFAIQNSDFKIFNFGDLFLLILAILGTMGLLPKAMATLAINIANTISK